MAKEFVAEQYVKPAALEKMDPRQFGTIPESSTTEAFHDGLPVYRSHELEKKKKRVMRIIPPCFMYDEALVKANLVTLSDRRQVLTDKLFKKILGNKDSKLRNLLTPQNAKHFNLRKGRQFNPFFF